MKVECTWGEGPDVMLSLDGASLVLYHNPENLDRWKHGTVTGGSVELTSEHAKEIAYQLIGAAEQAEELDRLASQYSEKEGGDE